MQAVPLPPYHCVQAEEVQTGSTFLVISGEPKQLSAFLEEAKRQPAWTVDADAHDRGVRFVRLKADINIPYRSIGGLFHSAQVHRLTVAMTTEPRICEAEDR